ncbi:MAG: hypothetical protein ACOVOV_12530, partial [Dolichospermum sp.]
VAATSPCTTAATATVTVTEQAAPNAGTNGTLTICAGTTVTSTQLFNALGGTPAAGGTWSPALAGAGTYTYTVAATSPCTTAATATVTVTEQAVPNANIIQNNQNLCLGNTINLTSNPTGGVWTSSNPSVASVDSISGIVTSHTTGTVTIIYTINGTGVCTGINTSDSILVTVNSIPNPPTFSITIPNCNILTGTVTVENPIVGATYTLTGTNPVVASQSNNTGIFSLVSVGTYTITTTINNCTSNSSIVQIDNNCPKITLTKTAVYNDVNTNG